MDYFSFLLIHFSLFQEFAKLAIISILRSYPYKL